MLPVSGAEQLKTSGANPGERPMISQSGAYSVLLRPAPYSLSGRNRFHRPAARALAFNASTIGVGRQRSPSAICWRKTGSFGYTCSFMNAASRRSRSFTLSEYSKFISQFLAGPHPRSLMPRVRGALRACARWHGRRRGRMLVYVAQ